MNTKHASRILLVSSLALSTLWSAAPVLAQSSDTLEQRIKKVMDRPEFAHSRFGLEIHRRRHRRSGLRIKCNRSFFVPGSTTKLLERRHHARNSRWQIIASTQKFIAPDRSQKDGTLQGDLVLVASGDLDLSNRIQPDDTLTFEDEDHSYGGPDSKGLPGDPLAVIRDFAKQIAAKGIKRIKGRVLVDASLFPEGYRNWAPA